MIFDFDFDFDLAGVGWAAADFPYGAPNWDHFLAGYTEVRPVTADDLAAGPWIHAVGLIENLRFHLVTKPLWRGTESLAEGCLEEVLDGLGKLDAGALAFSRNCHQNYR